MEWFKLYTRMPRDASVRAANKRANLSGWVYVLGMCYVAEHETDGFIPDHEPPHWGVPRVDKYVEALVSEGLWQPCDSGWMIRNWLIRQPGAAQVAMRRAGNARRQALFRDPGLKRAIRARDQDLCRYCGEAVTFGAGRAASSGSFDHIDPSGPNSLENLVVACVPCNSRKLNRPLDECGMELLPIGTNASSNALRNASREEKRREEIPPTPADAGAGCAAHYPTPAPNCRGCGTNPRAVRAESKRRKWGPWCGACDETSRMYEREDGKAARCSCANPDNVIRIQEGDAA